MRHSHLLTLSYKAPECAQNPSENTILTGMHSACFNEHITEDLFAAPPARQTRYMVPSSCSGGSSSSSSSRSRSWRNCSVTPQAIYPVGPTRATTVQTTHKQKCPTNSSRMLKCKARHLRPSRFYPTACILSAIEARPRFMVFLDRPDQECVSPVSVPVSYPGPVTSAVHRAMILSCTSG